MNSSMESGEVSLDGLEQQEAQQRMLAWLQTTGWGREQVNYKLRDWLFARQRYWGEPFPIIFPEDSQVCHLLPPCSYLFAVACLHKPPHTHPLRLMTHILKLMRPSSHAFVHIHLITLTSSHSPPRTHLLSTHLLILTFSYSPPHTYPLICIAPHSQLIFVACVHFLYLHTIFFLHSMSCASQDASQLEP